MGAEEKGRRPEQPAWEVSPKKKAFQTKLKQNEESKLFIVFFASKYVFLVLIIPPYLIPNSLQ